MGKSFEIKIIMNNKSSSKTPYPFFIILLSGLLIGLGLSWVAFATPPNFTRPIPTVLSPNATSKLSTGATTSLAQTVIEVGKPAPDFSLNDLDGKVVHLSDFTGKPVVINLWASWCIPCQDELPELEKIYEQYSPSGLVILGVNVTSQDHIQNVKEAVKKYQITYLILLDESGRVSGLYHMYGIPVSYFIDSKGILRRIQIGEILPEYLNNTFSEIIPLK